MKSDSPFTYGKYNLISLTVPTYTELCKISQAVAHAIAIVTDSTDDPKNIHKIPTGAYVFCPERQKWCRFADFPDKISLEDQFVDILAHHYRSRHEQELISALLRLKTEIYKQAPKSDVEFQPWAKQLSQIFLARMREFDKKQQINPMDLNNGFRTQVCLVFCMIIETARTAQDFECSLLFHLACKSTE